VDNASAGGNTGGLIRAQKSRCERTSYKYQPATHVHHTLQASILEASPGLLGSLGLRVNPRLPLLALWLTLEVDVSMVWLTR